MRAIPCPCLVGLKLILIVFSARFTEAQDQLNVVHTCEHHNQGREHPVIIASDQSEFVLIPAANVNFYGLMIPYPHHLDEPLMTIRFNCLSTCQGGIRRRPIELVFELIKKYGFVLYVLGGHLKLDYNKLLIKFF